MRQQPCAIVGMAFRFPGQINDPHILLQALTQGRDLVGDLPPQREELLGPLPTDYPRQASYLDEVTRFDAGLFNINGLEASYMDPQQRLLLELAWATLEDAALPWDRLVQERTGVFIGAHSHDYLERATALSTESAAYWNPGLNGAALANRISHVFDFDGPSITLNTACASSLEALVQACSAVQSGQCHNALVGGVNLILSPNVTMGALRAGMLSPDGRCKAFDASANGFVRGEGAVMLLIKPLDRAQAEGDRILATIAAACSGHGGRARSFTAPNLKRQRDLISRTLQAAGLKAKDISCIEAHGTGTSLGDSVEFAALKEAFEANSDQPLPHGHIALSSLKTNLGHLEAAAGLAAVIKMIVTMSARKLAPLVHLQEENPLLDLAQSPFRLIHNTEDWPQDRPLSAGISSFGFGGSGAHVILQGSTTTTPQSQSGLLLFPISAHNPARLQALAARLAQHLREAQPDLHALAHTLQRGRRHLQARAIIQATTHSELIAQLEDIAQSDSSTQLKRVALPGKRQPKPEANLAIEDQDYEAISQLWLKGDAIPWEQAWPQNTPRLALPTYPFAGKSYWLPHT